MLSSFPHWNSELLIMDSLPKRTSVSHCVYFLLPTLFLLLHVICDIELAEIFNSRNIVSSITSGSTGYNIIRGIQGAVSDKILTESESNIGLVKPVLQM